MIFEAVRDIKYNFVTHQHIYDMKPIKYKVYTLTVI